jgi:glutathione S-transferase
MAPGFCQLPDNRPALELDGGEVLVDSAAILDWLDDSVGPERALVPPRGIDRRSALRRIALATGAIDKIGTATYERLMRPETLRWAEWIARCRTQGLGALAALAAEPWPVNSALDQAKITTACAVFYARMADPETVPPGRFPVLDSLSAECEERPEFAATRPAVYAIPRG